MWAAGPRCVRAGQGGSGSCFYRHGFEMDREATVRYVSSPVSADTTPFSSPAATGAVQALPEEMPLQRGWGHPGPRAPSSRSRPNTLSRLDLQTGFSPLQTIFLPLFSFFFAFFTPHLKAEPPAHGMLEGSQHPNRSLAPTDRRPLGDTDATDPVHRQGTKGVSTLRTSQTHRFPAQRRGPGAGGQAGRETLTRLRISKIRKQKAAVLGNDSEPWEARSRSTRRLRAA